MSRNFTTDVDTQREYFNATYFNNSGENQIARYDTTLLKPFFPNPDQWKLAINRMRVPLSGIPLTRNNIPFEQWTVGIDYRPVASGTGGYTSVFNVKQYNQTTQTNYPSLIVNDNMEWELWNIYQNNASLSLDNITTPLQDATKFNNDGLFVAPVIDPSCAFTVALSASNPLNFNIYNALTSVPLQTVNTSSLGFTEILGFTISETFHIFVAYKNSAGYPEIYEFVPNGTTDLWTATTTYAPPAGSGTMTTCTSISYCINNGYFVAVYLEQNTVIPTQVRTIIYKGTIGNASLVSLGSGNISNSSSYYPCAIMNGNNYILLVDYDTNNVGTLEVYDTSFVLLTSFPNFNLKDNQNYLLGYDHYGNLLSNSSYQGSTTQLNLFTGGNRSTFFNPPNGCCAIATYQTAVVDQVPGGPYDIFTYQGYLNKINEAFQSCFNDLKTQKGASFLPTEAPSIIYNPQTRLFNLIVEGQYLTTNADGSNQYTIFMNDALWDKFYFPSSGKFQTIYNAIILQNYGINAVVGTGSNTLPQFIYVQQEDSTIYAFYDLVRIIVGTTRIPVSGDGEGKTFSNNGTVSNSAINMITDIVPDTTTLTPGSVIIYIPAGILRWYNLYAQQPFDKVDLILYYETKDGNIYPIQVVNGEFFSVKLEFKKGPGDF